ncbi:hypothetical protein [Streptomyces sp. NPDC046685]|uniref:hypothetical protein n=1 Tax=Streptomyces sp. NPDC046685 TaxID=3157202 RepID=UPI0033E4CA32
MSDSFAARYEPLIILIRAARAAGDSTAERAARGRLIDAYGRLGRREIGSTDEQNSYIVSRCLGVLPAVLQELGVQPDELPMPETRRSPTPPAASAPPQPANSAFSGEDAARIGDYFAHIGGPDDEPTDRFAVHDRPDDNMRHLGRPLPFAVVDTHDNLPVGWYADRDLAETMADAASRLRKAS